MKNQVTIAGITIGKCYKLRAYDPKVDYLSDDKGVAYISPTSKFHKVFRAITGLTGTKKSISLQSVDKKNVLVIAGTAL